MSEVPHIWIEVWTSTYSGMGTEDSIPAKLVFEGAVRAIPRDGEVIILDIMPGGTRVRMVEHDLFSGRIRVWIGPGFRLG
jgi:hypothetical protein